MDAKQLARAKKIQKLREQATELGELMGEAYNLGNVREGDDHAKEYRKLMDRIGRLVELNEGLTL